MKTSLIRRCYKLTNTLLEIVDRDMFLLLKNSNFPAANCTMRWLRVLFSREGFSISDNLVLWDYFFSDVDH